VAVTEEARLPVNGHGVGIVTLNCPGGVSTLKTQRYTGGKPTRLQREMVLSVLAVTVWEVEGYPTNDASSLA
jgi:hypothetical protein